MAPKLPDGPRKRLPKRSPKSLKAGDENLPKDYKVATYLGISRKAYDVLVELATEHQRSLSGMVEHILLKRTIKPFLNGRLIRLQNLIDGKGDLAD